MGAKLAKTIGPLVDDIENDIPRTPEHVANESESTAKSIIVETMNFCIFGNSSSCAFGVMNSDGKIQTIE